MTLHRIGLGPEVPMDAADRPGAAGGISAPGTNFSVPAVNETIAEALHPGGLGETPPNAGTGQPRIDSAAAGWVWSKFKIKS